MSGFWPSIPIWLINIRGGGGYFERDCAIEALIKKAEILGYSYQFPYEYTWKNREVDSQVDVSVIVPVYNIEKYIGQCIQSLMGQKTEFVYEVLLVDDGSVDSSGMICDKYAENYPMVSVMHQENKGLSCARNAGLEKVRGRYISFVDGDDCVEQDYIQVLMQKAAQAKADIVKADFYQMYSEGTTLPSGRYQRVKSSYHNGLGEDMLSFTYAWGAVYKREMWEEIRFPAGYLYEDMMIAHLLFYMAETFEYVDLPLYRYRKDNPTSILHTWGTKEVNPKGLDHVFLAYATLEFMYRQKIKVDVNILKLTIREFGVIVFYRMNKKYHPLAFELGCYTVRRLLCRITGEYEVFLNEKERKYVDAFLKGKYTAWRALCNMERWKAK